MTNTSAVNAIGRPREFDMQAALQAALLVFWRSGYAATSLDDLTAAMGLSRSSFYGAFGTKHDVLLAGVRLYVDGVYANLRDLAAAKHAPVDRIRAVVGGLARPRGDGNGCLLVNSIAELAPDDVKVCEIARIHVDRVTRLLQGLLAEAGHTSETSKHLAGTLIACAFGVSTLRKAGVPEATLAGLLAQVDRLLERPNTRGTKPQHPTK